MNTPKNPSPSRIATIRMGSRGTYMDMGGRTFDLTGTDRGMKGTIATMLCEAAGIEMRAPKGNRKGGR